MKKLRFFLSLLALLAISFFGVAQVRPIKPHPLPILNTASMTPVLVLRPTTAPEMRSMTSRSVMLRIPTAKIFIVRDIWRTQIWRITT